MPATLQDQLVVAISSRALFDFEEENRLFEAGDAAAYMQMQLERIDVPAPPGVAFSLVRKLLAFNSAERQRVEVVILSRNDPASGMRVFASAKAADMHIERGVFTRGRDPARIAVGWERGADGRFALTVQDNGVGFNPAQAAGLFGIFQRLHRESEFEGVGAGLAAVRAIVRRHGGEARAAAVPGEGCTVRVCWAG